MARGRGPDCGAVEELPGPVDLSSVGELRRRRLGWAAIGLAVAMLVAVTVIRVAAGGRSDRPVTAAPTPAVLPSPTVSQLPAPQLPQNQLLAMVATALGCTYCPPTRPSWRCATPMGRLAWSGPRGVASRWSMIRLSIWSGFLGGERTLGSATAYDSRTLARRGRITIPSWVNAAAPLGGRLWLASDAGVYVVSGPTGHPVLVPGSYRYTYDIAADPSRDRVLAVTTGLPGQTYGIDITNLYVGRDDLVTTGRSSLAVVDGMAWVGGFGAGRHIWLISGPDRQSALAVERKVGSGVVIWPGRHVLWIAYGPEGCRASIHGPERSWRAGRKSSGPITSTNGVVYAAASTGFLASTSIVTKRLPPRCPG